jgi:hypothetical protein
MGLTACINNDCHNVMKVITDFLQVNNRCNLKSETGKCLFALHRWATQRLMEMVP